jgi:hypothetical protein
MKDAEWDIVCSLDPIPLDFQAAGLKHCDTRIVYLNYASVALRLMVLAGSKHIPDNDPDVAGKYHGYTPENWNRGLTLAKFCVRESGFSHEKSETKGRATSAANDTPIETEFLRDEDFATMPNDPVEGADEAENTNNFYYACQDLEDAIDEDGDDLDDFSLPMIEELKEIDTHDTEFTQIFTTRLPAATNSSLSRQVRSQRELLTKQQTRDFCRSLLRTVTIVRSAEDINKDRSLQTIALGHMTSEIISHGQQMAITQETAVDKEDNQLSEEAKALIQRSALELKTKMAKNCAPLPNYADACEWCDVDPNTLRFYARPEDKDDKSLPDIVLKFWQPLSEYPRLLLYWYDNNAN